VKCRVGFVTNSSSSSFIVINATKGYETLPAYTDGVYRVGFLGETEFGWMPRNIHDIDSRINFAYLQALTVDNKEWVKMLEEVIKENSEVKEINFLLTDDWNSPSYGYIDHQSCASEGENTEMFTSKDTLKDFIFGEGSYIHTDNDNG
jgi:hypothetical protein